MANVAFGNTFFVDSTGVLTTNRTHVHSILITPTSQNAELILGSVEDSITVMEIHGESAGHTRHFVFDVPLHFPDGVRVKTITDAIITIVYTTR